MSHLARLIKRLLVLIWISFYSTSALADLTLSSEFIELIINEPSGKISTIKISDKPSDTVKNIPIIENGSLLSLSAAVPSVTNSQKTISVKETEKTIKTTFSINKNLILTREVKLGNVPYVIHINFELQNLSAQPLDIVNTEATQFIFALGFNGISDSGGGYGSSIYAYKDPFFYKNGNIERLTFSETEQLTNNDPVTWLGWANRYYVIAIRSIATNQISQPNLILNSVINDSNFDGDDTVSTKLLSLFPDTSLKIQPADHLKFGFEIIAAPKNKQLLSAVEPNLDGVVLMNLWNWFRWICFAVNQLLAFLFHLTGNWGLALILMAFVIRLITIPITRISLKYQKRAVAQQERIKPLVSSLKDKYEGLELSQKMVDLHKKEQFDQLLPFKSLLGLFIQIPILIALFNVVAESPELKDVSFLWIDDLSLSDRILPLGFELPFFGRYLNLLPFIMAAITVISTYYARGNNKQYGALFSMATVFFLLFYSFPAALVLYWTFSNIFQLLQQIIENYLADVKR